MAGFQGYMSLRTDKRHINIVSERSPLGQRRETMSTSQPALITGASSGMGAVYAGCFPGRFRDAAAPNNSEVRILSIAAHPLLREGIGAIIADEEGISQIPAAAAGREGIETYRAARPDVTLLDLHLPDMSGI